MASYKHWKSKGRPLSLFTSTSSPVLQSKGNHPNDDRLQMHQSFSTDACSDTSNLDTTLTSYNSEYFADYELEISVLQHSPTCSRRKVWTFSTPTQSPVSGSRLSSNSSSTPSPDSTPLAGDCVSNKRSDPPSPNDSMSSALQRFAKSLHSHSSSAIEGKGAGHRYMVISEMINTERKYVKSLETLQNVYLHALEHVVAPRDLRLLFPAQLEPLIEKHTNLLEKLEERMSENTCFPGIVGDIFSRLLKDSNSDFLQMYSAYMNEFKVAMTTLAKYDTSSVQFRELLLLCQHSPSCEGLSLASYLLTPIQRLPRYELLLKELLHQTPLDHPDNFYVSDAIDRIHQELVRLNQSIKSCQLACSVRRVSNSTLRKASFRVRTGKAIAMLKRHVSTANIDDYSSGDSSTGPETQPSRIIRRRRANLKSPVYHSEENLLSGDEDMETRRPFHTNSLMNIRPATSCSDLILTFGDETKQKTLGLLTPLASLPTTPEPSSARPTCPSEDNFINPLTSDDGLQINTHRLSMCSTASSTSGIGSIGTSQFDLRVGSLTPISTLNSDPMTSTPTSSPVVLRVVKPDVNSAAATTNSMDTAGYMKRGSKRRMSWSSAFKMFNRKSGRSASASKVLDIGSPKNFRHVQHWFPTLTESAECT